MINLSKNSQISLAKNGIDLKEITIGLDWGSIQESSFWGLLKSTQGVDLDGTVSVFDAQKKEIETVFFNNLKSKDGAIKHSGDDRIGDGLADNKDNEVISINLEKVNPMAQSIFIYLNSYKQQDFATIPYVKIKLVEGKNHNPTQTFATFSLASNDAYKGFVSMLMAKIQKVNGRWEFTALGDAIPCKNIAETIRLISQSYL